MAKKLKQSMRQRHDCSDEPPIVLSPPAASPTLTPTSPTVHLTHLKEVLKKIAADRASDERLPKKERDLFNKYGEVFSRPIAELDLTDRQSENAQEFLCKLFEALLPCFVAARVEENHSNTAKASNAKWARTKIVIEEAEKRIMWRDAPPGARIEMCPTIANAIKKSVNERIKTEVQLSKREKRLAAAGRPVVSEDAIKMTLRRWLSTTRSYDRTIVRSVQHDRSIVQ